MTDQNETIQDDKTLRLYACMYYGNTSRWGFYEPEYYLPDTHCEDIMAESRGQARALFAKLYNLEFTTKMSIRLLQSQD